MKFSTLKGGASAPPVVDRTPATHKLNPSSEEFLFEKHQVLEWEVCHIRWSDFEINLSPGDIANLPNGGKIIPNNQFNITYVKTNGRNAILPAQSDDSLQNIVNKLEDTGESNEH